MKNLAKLYLLQSYRSYRYESDQWIRIIKQFGIDQFLDSHILISEFAHKNSEKLKIIEQNFCNWVGKNNSEGLKKIVSCMDDEYPKKFFEIKNPPLVIFVNGHLNLNQTKLISVVGSREVRSFSSDWMEENLTSFLKENQVSVCSGGARGVDMKAHQICVRLKRPTAVLLPSGLEHIYPIELKSWQESIIQTGGGFISEYAPDAQIRKQNFYCRNRLISALGVFTLIVQAEKRSGSLLTAKHCADQGKVVGVVPGHPYDPYFSGNLGLIRDGAMPIIDAFDLNILYRSEIL